MPQGYKRIKNDISYFKKEHFCPDCNTKLEKVPASKVVNSFSPEAKDFDFKMAGHVYAIGDIEFTWDEFECPACKRHLTVKEMKEIEGGSSSESSSILIRVLYYIFIILLIANILIKHS